MNQDVIIVGGGTIGASIALHLAGVGRKVLVIDASLPGAGASGRSFGWVNASFYHDQDHHRLRAASMRLWQDLLAQIPSAHAQFSGALVWDMPQVAQGRMAQELSAQDYPVKQLRRAQIADMVPDLGPIPDEALYLPDEGAVDAGQVTLEWLAASGARVLSGLTVTGLLHKAGRVVGVETQNGPIRAATIVVAAGAATEALLATAGLSLPMLRRPGLVLATRPVRACTPYVLVPPFGEVRQDGAGRIIASTVAGHQSDATEYVSGSPEAHGLRTLEALHGLFPGLDLEMESVSQALRPVPQDGLPAVGAFGPDGLFVATLHSGVTLAPIIGKLLALEIQGQPQHAWLAPYRPDRF